MSQLEKITVIGGGLMGRGIAQVFASEGHDVCLMDLKPDLLVASIEQIEVNLRQMTENGITFKSDIPEIVNRITTTTDMAEACSNCDVVTEAVFENLELKQNIFKDLDRLSPPDTVLCSNTSVMSITEIASKSVNKKRIIGTHWWNPPYLIPLVEVIKADESDIGSVEKVFDLLKRVGKHPIRVEKDVPGFVANRLQHALWREAFHLIDEGICDAETVDEAIAFGFGLRLPVLGPVENSDMVGLDLILSIHDYILKHLNASPEPSKTLKSRAEAGHMGFKTGKGFRNWTKDQIAASQKKLVDYLMKALADQKK